MVLAFFPKFITTAGFDTAQNADQTLGDLVAFGDLGCDVLLALRRRLQVDVGAIVMRSNHFGVYFELVAQTIDEGSEVLVEDTLRPQETVHPGAITD